MYANVVSVREEYDSTGSRIGYVYLYEYMLHIDKDEKYNLEVKSNDEFAGVYSEKEYETIKKLTVTLGEDSGKPYIKIIEPKSSL